MRYLLVLLLAGCAGEMTKLAEPQRVIVDWTREKPTRCGEVENALACSDVNGTFTRCWITAPEDVHDAVLGRELLKCFGFAAVREAPWYETVGPYRASTDLVKLAAPKSVAIEWVRASPTPLTCRNPRLQGSPLGCAQMTTDYSRCRIIAHEWAGLGTLGHELRHCFGWQHEADIKWRAEQPKP